MRHLRFLGNRHVIAAGIALSALVAGLYAMAYFADPFASKYGFGGDNYQVFATLVAERHPEYFAADPILGNARNYGFYRTAFTALVEMTHDLGYGPGAVYGLLAIPFNALRVFGFFLLGLCLFGSRRWAIILALAAVVNVRFALFGEWWGIPSGTYARTAYESVFPYLLLLALAGAPRPSTASGVMGLAGLATYLHPVSGPPVAFALWALVVSRQDAGTRIRAASMAAVVYGLLVLPYVVHFDRATDFGQPASAELITAMHNIYPEYMNLKSSLLRQSMSMRLEMIFGLGAAGLFVAWRMGEREMVAGLGIFSAALILSAVIFPILDQALAAKAGRLPLELDFVRAAKYLTPIAVIGLVYGSKAIWEAHVTKTGVAYRFGLAVAVAFAFLLLTRGTAEVFAHALCGAWPASDAECVSPAARGELDALYAAIEREVPAGELVHLSADVPYARGYGISIFSHRPEAWSWKEGGILAYTNPTGLLQWYRRRLALQELARVPASQRPSALRALLGDWNVHFVVLPSQDPVNAELQRSAHADVRYRNSFATLLELR